MLQMFLAAALSFGFLTTSVSAQTLLSKIFVASTGSDTNDGSRATPKRSFQKAHDAVAPGGEIVALDTAAMAPSRSRRASALSCRRV